MSRCGREEKSPRQLAPKTGLDWTGPVGRASQPGKVSVSSVYWQFSTRISAMKLGKYLGQRRVSRYLPGRQHRASSGQSPPEPQTECPGLGLRCPGCCIGYEDSTIETGPAHWFQAWFDVRLSQPKLGWDADSVRKSSLQIYSTPAASLLCHSILTLWKQVDPPLMRAIVAVCPLYVALNAVMQMFTVWLLSR